MHEIEDLVRSTLERRSGEVTPHADLAERVRRRSRRARRRTQSVVAAAVAAAAVLIAAPTLAGLVRPPATGPAPAAEPPAPVIAPFPFRPGLALGGFGAPVAEIADGQPVLRLTSADDRWVSVSVTLTRPEDTAASSRRQVAVRGRAGTLTTGDTTALTWQEDGRWVRVEADSRVEAGLLIAYADGLEPGGSVPVRVPFRFDVPPDGLILDTVTAAVMTFRPPGVPAGDDFRDKLVVSLSSVEQMPWAARPVTAGVRPARVLVSDEATTVYADLGDGRMLEIQSAARTGLSEQWLAAFAAGVHPTSDAVVSSG